jgi:NADH:ubiquinone oxidoreductase subunit
LREISRLFFCLKYFFYQKLGKSKNKIKYLHSKNNNNHLKRRKMFVFKSFSQSFTPVGTGAALLRGLFQS